MGAQRGEIAIRIRSIRLTAGRSSLYGSDALGGCKQPRLGEVWLAARSLDTPPVFTLC